MQAKQNIKQLFKSKQLNLKHLWKNELKFDIWHNSDNIVCVDVYILFLGYVFQKSFKNLTKLITKRKWTGLNW